MNSNQNEQKSKISFTFFQISELYIITMSNLIQWTHTTKEEQISTE